MSTCAVTLEFRDIYGSITATDEVMLLKTTREIISFTVISATLLYLPLSVVGHTCGTCDISDCPELPRNCTSLTTDACGCCPVCARLENETCGGSFGLLGKCADGLECFILPQIGQPIIGQEEGVCKLKADASFSQNCSNIQCENENELRLDCPADSVIVRTKKNNTGICCREAFACQCDRHSCSLPVCKNGQKSVLDRKATGTPGNCCDQYICETTVSCFTVICPDLHLLEQEQCADDSYRMPSIPTEDGCCFFQQGCKCKPVGTCPAVECPEGKHIKVIAQGTGMPGSCCDQFECVSDTGLTCRDESNDYKNGESWKLDTCTLCTCKNGLTFCKRESCSMLYCGWMVVPAEECCPVCKGCMSESGNLYAESEVWSENSCVTCQCTGGQVFCQAETCAVNCMNPRTVPGQCCPVCDDVPVIEQPPECPDLTNCTLSCPVGLQRTKDGCFHCKCHPENCNIECRYGFEDDQNGKEICKCLKPPQPCPSLEDCNKQCLYGYEKSSSGCLKCHCNKCPPFNCSKHCIYGYYENDRGCKLCKCLDESPPAAVEITDKNKLSGDENGNPCLSIDGVRHEDGESWHDGCRFCYCYNGKEMCALITCPTPDCNNPVYRVGDCCPICPGSVMQSPVHGTKEKCLASDGMHYLEGETWQLDKCTRCICHDSNVLCETQVCPPLLCHHPVLPKHQCCPLCPGEKDLAIPVKPLTMKPCRNEAGSVFKQGEVWKTNPCQSCTCHNGQIHCFSQTCPFLTCSVTRLKKGQCCPTCVEQPIQYGVCISQGLTYITGEKWFSMNCTECHCIKGETFCFKKPCLKLDCQVLVRKPEECCPSCFNDPQFISSNDVRTLNNEELYTTEQSTEYPALSITSTTKTVTENDKYLNTVIVLAVLTSLLVIVIVVLVSVIVKQRHSGVLHMNSGDVSTAGDNIKIRPKSTNLDLQGAMPGYLLESKGMTKHYIFEKEPFEKGFLIPRDKIPLENGNIFSTVDTKNSMNSTITECENCLNDEKSSKIFV